MSDNLFIDVATLRAALMDVIDTGCAVSGEICECEHDRKMHDTNDVMGPAGHCKDWDDGCDGFTLMTHRSWVFHRDESDSQTALRSDFADAVVKRAQTLRSSLNLGIKLENYCPRHIKLRLPDPTASYCADCEKELREKIGHE